jgi:hypothetical protein
MEDLASRVTTRIPITTDGHRAYEEAVEGAFGMNVDHAMLIKLYGAPFGRPDTRYSPAVCIGTRTEILSGNPNRQHISTSFVERQNLSLQVGVRRFTRLTNAFSQLEMHPKTNANVASKPKTADHNFAHGRSWLIPRGGQRERFPHGTAQTAHLLLQQEFLRLLQFLPLGRIHFGIG